MSNKFARNYNAMDVGRAFLLWADRSGYICPVSLTVALFKKVYSAQSHASSYGPWFDTETGVKSRKNIFQLSGSFFFYCRLVCKSKRFRGNVRTHNVFASRYVENRNSFLKPVKSKC